MHTTLTKQTAARLALALFTAAIAVTCLASGEVTLQDAERVAGSLARNATFEERRAAVELYTKVLSRADLEIKDRAKALAHRGHLYSQMGMSDAARSDLDAVVKLLPNDWLAWLMRGEIALAQGNFDIAISDFSKSMELVGRPSNILLTLRGDAHFKKGNYERAIDDYLEVVRLHREHGKELFGSDPGTRSAGLRSTYKKLADAYAELAKASGR